MTFWTLKHQFLIFKAVHFWENQREVSATRVTEYGGGLYWVGWSNGLNLIK